MAPKKRKKKKIRNPYQVVAINRSGAGFHKDKRKKRKKDDKSWKEDLDNGKT
jgi:uncharacterized protein (DUF1015 family)